MSKEKADLRAKLNDVPHKPGVYLMRDRFSRVIYVGKARDLRKRLAHYFTPSRQARAELKTRALIDSIWDFECHLVRSDAEAVLYEGRLIKEFRPKYNVSFRDDKRFLLVRVNLNDPFPRFQLTRIRKEDGARYFGPFAHSGALRSTLNAMRKRFGLRSCRPFIPGETDYKHCLDHIIKQCSAPCVAKITREAYHAKVKEACEFLEGRSSEMLSQIEEEMKKAAAALNFEKATELRNMLDDIKSTTRQERQKKFVREIPSTVIPEHDLEELRDALQLQSVPAVIECFDISNISTTHKVASMVQFRNGRPDRSNYRRYRIKTVEGQDDFASMAEVVGRRYARVLRESGN
ncbi:MAG TPA: UvrB/UvrC motif-containing protein, partial [Chthoniobacterales bacterium]